MPEPDALPLPRWDMTPLFPGLNSPEFGAAFTRLREEIRRLAALFDSAEVRRSEDARVDAALAARFDEVVTRMNAVLRILTPVRAYIAAFVSTNAADDRAQSLASELRSERVLLDQLESRFIAWAGSLEGEALLAASPAARDHAYPLWVARETARHQMPEGEESLVAALRPGAIAAWARLHADISALLTIPLTVRDEERTLPMSIVRGLANDPDRATRQAAYEAELMAWERAEVPLAAALNGVKAWQGVLNGRRGHAADVEPTLLENGIDAAILGAMQEAVVESFPDFRRYLQAKARRLRLERLAWWDVNAPLGGGSRKYAWSEAEAFLEEQFGRYSARMREFAARAFRERWIDAEPRPGKEGGAFCMEVRPGESRILMNYDGSFNSVSTLAHELGHAYHNLNLEARTPWQRRTPSTLAETASIFCETLAVEAALQRAAPDERLELVEASLQRDLLVVVDIHSRFLFETRVLERRRRRELSPGELCELMLEAQRETYGDGLDATRLHPYMWAVKGHYYGPLFYNYPYTFGLLFGLGLYARYREEPDEFRGRYDALLSATGMASAADLADRFGLDIRRPAFWRASLDVIRGSISEFERLAEAPGPEPEGAHRKDR